jgi:hypothetical protein
MGIEKDFFTETDVYNLEDNINLCEVLKQIEAILPSRKLTADDDLFEVEEE